MRSAPCIHPRGGHLRTVASVTLTLLFACGEQSDSGTTATSTVGSTTNANTSTSSGSMSTSTDPTSSGGPGGPGTSETPDSSTTSTGTTVDPSTTAGVTDTTTTTGTTTTTTTTTTGESSTTEASTTTTGDPEPKLDIPPAPACDLIEQDCPDGQKCMPYGPDWSEVKCVEVMDGGAAPGQPCTVVGDPNSGVDSCDAAGMCWGVDPNTLAGKCYAFCMPNLNEPLCANPTWCVMAENGAIPLCLTKYCHPFWPQKQCPAGETCLPNPLLPFDSYSCFPDLSKQGGQEFDACEVFNGCEPGFLCLDPGLGAECDQQAPGCCLSFCDLSAPECNGVNQECIPWWPPNDSPPGYDTLGTCMIPQ